MNILLVIDIIIFLRVNHSTKSDSIRHGIIIHSISAAVKRSAAATFFRDLLLTGGTAKTGLAPKTVNSAISILKNILEYARKERGLQVADIKDVSVRE